MGNNESYLDKHGYKIEEAGTFGMATIVKSKETERKAVITEVLSNKEAKKEVSILQGMKHPNIVCYIESFTEQDKLHIVMEYCEGGDLSNEIKVQKEKKVHFQVVKITEWFVQICQALEHVHDKKVMHRNIKPQNIFLTKNGQIKLGDFGISNTCKRPDGSTWIYAGINLYMCPEVLHDHPYTKKSDMWSLGCVLYELCMLQNSLGKTSISKHYSSEFQDLVRDLLVDIPADRPSVQEVLKKPFIQQHIQRPTPARVLLGSSRAKLWLNGNYMQEQAHHEVLGEGEMKGLKKDVLSTLPSYWDPMAEKEVLKKVELSSGSQAYKTVARDFLKTVGNFTIRKIERVQNFYLWQAYSVCEKRIKAKNGESAVGEKMLYHGTKKDSCAPIEMSGFNRSYAHITAFGVGTYFAVKASYSANDRYSPPHGGVKRVYVARVLTGRYTLGNGTMKVTPPRGSDPTDCYDSLVDNQQTPSMFVIFHDHQAYPEYLITFS